MNALVGARPLRRAWLVGVLLLACGRREHAPPAPPPSRVALGEGVVARVGDERIEAELVGAVATSTGKPPRAALDDLLEDALVAAVARARGLSNDAAVRGRQRAALARATVDRLRESARAMGPPTAEEIAEMSAARWMEVDTPEQVYVVHAVVRPPKNGTPERDDEGRALAQRIANAVAAVPVDAFVPTARAVPTDGRTVAVETLPPFVRDGRAAVQGDESSFDRDFVAAAFALTAPGEVSPPVRTAFGWHVLRLVRRAPAKHLSVEERTALFRDDILRRRSRRAYEAVLEAGRRRATPTVDSAAATLLAQLRFP